jgi:hypothetical protein
MLEQRFFFEVGDGPETSKQVMEEETLLEIFRRHRIIFDIEMNLKDIDRIIRYGKGSPSLFGTI